jgi:hypothetical protein
MPVSRIFRQQHHSPFGRPADVGETDRAQLRFSPRRFSRLGLYRNRSPLSATRPHADARRAA